MEASLCPSHARAQDGMCAYFYTDKILHFTRNLDEINYRKQVGGFSFALFFTIVCSTITGDVRGERGCSASELSHGGLNLLLSKSRRLPAPLFLVVFAVSRQMPSRWDPRHMEPLVSQVPLILIGSGMTYCQGEGDCHGPTGAEGWRREE